MARLTLACMMGLVVVVHGLPKILALHGGDETIASFQQDAGLIALRNALSSTYEFVFAQAPNTGNVWFPNDDSFPTASLSTITAAVTAHGPIHGILGYSQGAGIALSYVGQNPGTFQIAAFYCLAPVEDTALRNGLTTNSPFNGMPAMFFVGAQDSAVQPAWSLMDKSLFTNPLEV
jgi:pimeloyl-ACP methyl ester carboxylesterase